MVALGQRIVGVCNKAAGGDPGVWDETKIVGGGSQ